MYNLYETILPIHQQVYQRHKVRIDIYMSYQPMHIFLGSSQKILTHSMTTNRLVHFESYMIND